MVEGNDKSFEAIKHVDPAGKEFWFASELMVALEYDRKDRFFELIDRAMEAAKNSGINPDDHFSTLGKMITIGKGGERLVLDYTLSRYACYLVAQNGDPRQKKQIALAQTYFALQTRRQEVNQERMEELERLSARQKLTQTEKEFASTLFERGIDSLGLAVIKSAGDMALFGGNTTRDMKRALQVSGIRPLADFLPTLTIKAKDLAAEMTTFKTKEKNLKDKITIKHTHVTHNQRVRRVLTDEGIYPENLPAAEDIRKVERRVKKEDPSLVQGRKPLEVEEKLDKLKTEV